MRVGIGGVGVDADRYPMAIRQCGYLLCLFEFPVLSLLCETDLPDLFYQKMILLISRSSMHHSFVC